MEYANNSCDEITAEADAIDDMDLNKMNIGTMKREREKYPTKIEKYDSEIDKCTKKGFNDAVEKKMSAETTLINVYNFINKYRIDQVATTPNMTDKRVVDLISELNKEIDYNLNYDISPDRKKILLKKIKETLEFKYDGVVPTILEPYKNALKKNAGRINSYLSNNTSFFGGSHRKKSRSRTRNRSRGKKSKSKSKRIKSKSKRK